MNGTCIDNRQLFQLSIAIVINSTHLYLPQHLHVQQLGQLAGLTHRPGHGHPPDGLDLAHGGPVVVGQVGLDGHPVGVMLVPRLHRVLGHHHGEAV